MPIQKNKQIFSSSIHLISGQLCTVLWWLRIAAQDDISGLSLAAWNIEGKVACVRILIEEQAGLAVLQVADPSETLHQGGGGGSEFS